MKPSPIPLEVDPKQLSQQVEALRRQAQSGEDRAIKAANLRADELQKQINDLAAQVNTILKHLEIPS